MADSPVPEQVGSITRDILLIASVLPALLAVLGTYDVTKITIFIASQQFAPVLGLIVTGGVVLWRQIITRKRKAEIVAAKQVTPVDAQQAATAVADAAVDEAARISNP